MDIQNRNDIVHIVEAFYHTAMYDEVIGHFFTKVIPLELDTHLPRIIDFWESVLFGNAKYQGNPVLKHIHLHQLSALEQRHFDRWLTIWNSTINKRFSGEKAEEATEKARMMAQLMMFKIKASSDQGFVQ